MNKKVMNNQNMEKQDMDNQVIQSSQFMQSLQVIQFTLEDIELSLQCLFNNKKPKLWYFMPTNTESNIIKQKSFKLHCIANGIDTQHPVVKQFCNCILEGRYVLTNAEFVFNNKDLMTTIFQYVGDFHLTQHLKSLFHYKFINKFANCTPINPNKPWNWDEISTDTNFPWEIISNHPDKPLYFYDSSYSSFDLLKNKYIRQKMQQWFKKTDLKCELIATVWHPKNWNKFKYLDPEVFNDEDFLDFM